MALLIAARSGPRPAGPPAVVALDIQLGPSRNPDHSRIGRSGTGPTRVLFPATVAVSMHSVGERSGADARVDAAPSAAAVRIVYNAVRTLVPGSGTLRLHELLTVTRLDPRAATAAMCRLAREGPFTVHPLVADDEPVWFVRRDDRLAGRRETAGGRLPGRPGRGQASQP